MSEIKDGGPAFPPQDRVLVTPIVNHEQLQSIADAFAHDRQTGMTLRDYFAAHALSSLSFYELATTHTSIASHAYKLADAMLQAREAKL